ncbi:unnamed protein product [marine sediment metagenome]|uniref:DUF91 domain-containing protein n=1 Tax=marine sediment metagenome TaxID=412755 RepID=X1IPB0_9ZZZZ
MADLGAGQKPVLRPHYPHMLQEDNSVWHKFLQTDAHRLKEVWYDVKVGLPVFLPVGASDLERRIAAGVSRKRIDVVCHVAGGFWVVEIKPRASMLAIGQVISYVRMFNLEYAPGGQVIPVIVCDSYDEDLLEEFDELGVLVLMND